MIMPDKRKLRPRDVKINNEKTCVAFKTASVCDRGLEKHMASISR